MRSYTCIVNVLINKNFLGLNDRYCLIEMFLCTHVGTHMSCKYCHVQLPESFKGTDSSGETLLQPMGNSRLQKYVIKHSLMFTMKWLGSFLWMCQLRITETWIELGRLRTRNSRVVVSPCLHGSGALVSFSVSVLAERRKHIELMNAHRCVCAHARVCIYIDMVFRDNTVQTANMFSVTNARDFKRNRELNVLFCESGPDRVWGNWIELFLKIRKFQSYSYFLA